MVMSARSLARPAPTGSDSPTKLPAAADGRHHLVRNIVAGGGSSLLKIGIQLAMLPIMGRLLGPHEFGLYATALPLISFFAVIADGGLGVSLAKEKVTETTVWSTAFYVVLGLGVILALLVNACGWGLASMMHEPRLRTLMAILSASFLLIAISVLPAARLVRSNDLVSLALVDVVVALLGAAVAIGFALAGFGALSLAIQYVASYGARSIALNVLAFEAPGREFSLRALAHHVNTGGVLVAGRLTDLICRLGENLLVSSAFGASGLGAYTFANQISRFLCEAASNPIWSALYAQSLREHAKSLPILLVDMARLMTLATFPPLCLIAASAPQLFRYGLGSKWAAASPLLEVLAPSYAVAGVASLGGAVLLAGSFNRAFLATFAFLSIGRMLAVALGPWVGLTGVAWSIAAMHVAYGLAMVLTVRAVTAASDTALVVKLSGPVTAGLVGGLACYGALAVLPPTASSLAAALCGGAAAFFAALYLIEGPRLLRDLRSVSRLLAKR